MDFDECQSKKGAMTPCTSTSISSGIAVASFRPFECLTCCSGENYCNTVDATLLEDVLNSSVSNSPSSMATYFNSSEIYEYSSIQTDVSYQDTSLTSQLLTTDRKTDKPRHEGESTQPTQKDYVRDENTYGTEYSASTLQSQTDYAITDGSSNRDDHLYNTATMTTQFIDSRGLRTAEGESDGTKDYTPVSMFTVNGYTRNVPTSVNVCPNLLSISDFNTRVWDESVEVCTVGCGVKLRMKGFKRMIRTPYECTPID